MADQADASLTPDSRALSPPINEGVVIYQKYQQDNINDDTRKAEFPRKSARMYQLTKRQGEAVLSTPQQATPSEGEDAVSHNSKASDFYIDWQTGNVKNTLTCHRTDNGNNVTAFICHSSTYAALPLMNQGLDVAIFFLQMLILILILIGIILVVFYWKMYRHLTHCITCGKKPMAYFNDQPQLLNKINNTSY